MRVFHLNLIFLIASQIKNVYSPSPVPSSPGSLRPLSRFPSFKIPFGLNGYPCDMAKVNSGAADAHDACQNECLIVKTVINNCHKMNPDNFLVKCLYSRCGLVTEGRCNYFRNGYFPVCWCHTPKIGSQNRRRFPLFICRTIMPFNGRLTNICESTTEKREIEDTNSSKPNTASRPNKSSRLTTASMGSCCGLMAWFNRCKTFGGEQKEMEERDEAFESLLLTADFQLSGNRVIANIDTGAGITIIHKNIAGDIRPLDKPLQVSNHIQNQLEIFGQTTIYLQTIGDITIPVTGLVINANFLLFLGIDFLMAYASKINILQDIMEINIGTLSVNVPLKFRRVSTNQMSMFTVDKDDYDGLYISGQVNGVPTRICIDTGASLSVINKDIVDPENIRADNTLCHIGGDTSDISTSGRTDVELLVEGMKFSTTAVVLNFNTRESLLTGNSFNIKYIDLIDFQKQTVTLKLPGTKNRVTTQAFLKEERT